MDFWELLRNATRPEEDWTQRWSEPDDSATRKFADFLISIRDANRKAKEEENLFDTFAKERKSQGLNVLSGEQSVAGMMSEPKDELTLKDEEDSSIAAAIKAEQSGIPAARPQSVLREDFGPGSERSAWEGVEPRDILPKEDLWGDVEYPADKTLSDPNAGVFVGELGGPASTEPGMTKLEAIRKQAREKFGASADVGERGVISQQPVQADVEKRFQENQEWAEGQPIRDAQFMIRDIARRYKGERDKYGRPTVDQGVAAQLHGLQQEVRAEQQQRLQKKLVDAINTSPSGLLTRQQAAGLRALGVAVSPDMVGADINDVAQVANDYMMGLRSALSRSDMMNPAQGLIKEIGPRAGQIIQDIMSRIQTGELDPNSALYEMQTALGLLEAEAFMKLQSNPTLGLAGGATFVPEGE